MAAHFGVKSVEKMEKARRHEILRYESNVYLYV